MPVKAVYDEAEAGRLRPKSELRPLLLPRCRHPLHQALQRHPARLLPPHDHLDDVRREQRQPHDPPDVRPVHAQRLGELGDGRVLPTVDQLLPVEGPRQRLLDVELEIQRGLAISGWVVDPEGRPVSGAKVTSTAAPNMPLFLEPRNDIVGWAVEELAVSTDEEGRFRITRLPSGNRRLVAHHPDWVTWDHVVAAGSLIR